jgi:hypothetical protein
MTAAAVRLHRVAIEALTVAILTHRVHRIILQAKMIRYYDSGADGRFDAARIPE